MNKIEKGSLEKVEILRKELEDQRMRITNRHSSNIKILQEELEHE